MKTRESCNVELEEQPMCCAISPTASLLATGLIDGRLFLHSFSQEHAGSKRATTGGKAPSNLSYSEVQAATAHSPGHSCRAVAFTTSGDFIASGSSDMTVALFDTATTTLVRRVDEAHAAGVNTLFCPLPDVLASGDEDGGIKLWDLRAKKIIMSYKKHTDFISGFALHQPKQLLLASCGDGTLSIHDLRKANFMLRTEDDADDEILSVAVVKHGRKVVAGTQSGVLNIYSWGAMNDCSDRFPGHPEAVDAVIKFDEDTVLTGSSDGAVRIISVQPNKLLGLVGEHEELPIECLSLSADRRVLASASHDQTVKLWDMSFLLDSDDEEEEEEEQQGGGEEEEEEEEEQLQVGASHARREAVGTTPLKGKPASGPAYKKQKGEVLAMQEGEEVEDDNDGEEEESEEEEEVEEEGEEEGADVEDLAEGSKDVVRPETAGSDEADGDEDDSDSDDENKKKKTRNKKFEKTRWKNGKNAVAPDNFFGDLL